MGKFRTLFKYLLSAAVAGLLLYFSFRGVDWKDFGLALKSCRWEFVILSMCFAFLSFILKGLRWRGFILPLDRSIARLTCCNSMCIGNIMNLIFPRLGDVVRCGYITRRSKTDTEGNRLASMDKVVGTVVTDRLMDVAALLILLAAMLALMWNRFGGFFSANVDTSLPRKVLTVIGLVALCALAVYALYRLRDSNRLFRKIWGIAGGIWRGIRSCAEMESWWSVVLYTVLVWGCFWMQVSSIVWAVQGIDPHILGSEASSAVAALQSLGLADSFFLMIVGSMSTFIPVPGGFGAYHYVIGLALSSVYGIPMETGVLFATLSHESQTIIQIMTGGSAWIYETLRKNN